MLDQDAMSKREALAYAAGYESCQRDHAAEVKRMTAELAKSEEKSEARRKLSNARQDMVDCLTARVAELESGSAFVGEEITAEEFADMPVGVLHWIESGDALSLMPKLNRSRFGWARRFHCVALPTPPLPTAGDEAKTVGQKVVERLQDAVDEPDFAGMAARRMIEIAEREGKPGQSTSEAVMDWLGRQIDEIDEAPAEPDSPAEERPSKLRDESWIREAADAEDQHASVCAGDMAPTKPDCLDGVPAVLCEYRNDYRPMGERWWVYGAVVDGRVAGVQDGKTGRPAIWHLMYLTPIHHDPTDAAAVELRGRIAEWGGE